MSSNFNSSCIAMSSSTVLSDYSLKFFGHLIYTDYAYFDKKR